MANRNNKPSGGDGREGITAARIAEAAQDGSVFLDLSGLELTHLPESIGMLAQLQTLDLNDNRLTQLPKSIAQLAQLQNLDLRRNQLTQLPESITQLAQLEALNVSNNQLTHLPESIGQLTQLQRLNLNGNQLTQLPESIGHLAQLGRLDFEDNQLTQLPESIGQLARLQTLNFTGNQLTQLPVSIGRLAQLRNLYLNGNKLTQLLESLGQLALLQELQLSNNQLTQLPESFGQLAQLMDLRLRDNQLTQLPESIGQLALLNFLDLKGNQLTQLPESFGRLAQLHTLDLKSNQLAQLPKSMRRLTALQWLDLDDNPALGIPPEELSPGQPAATLDYYFRTRSLAKRPLNEAKLILVGRGGAGKTSLRKRLLSDDWNPMEDKTPGIQVTSWALTLSSGENVKLNLWDFGGQEIMHATHQFFLTRRSLYLLVLNAREGEQDSNVEYWLRLVASYGGGSPALVVINQCDQHPLDLDERGLRRKFPFIRAFLRTDCATRQGLADLRTVIERESAALPDLRTPFPTTWFGLKKQLAELPGECITYDSYRQLCASGGEPDPANQELLISFLHDLGAVLHFRDDHRLNHLGVLKPEWVTQGIYGLLNADALKAAGGLLPAAQLGQLLDPARYPHERHGYLLQLMEKFDLCFELPGLQRSRFLIPELLPKETPALPEWGDAAATPPRPDAPPHAAPALAFEYHYNLLPEGLLPRFIVRTHALSEGAARWRSGVALRKDGAEALVRGDVQDRRVSIVLRGAGGQPRDLLAIIRGHFEEIHRGIAGLTAEEKIPVPGYPQVQLDYQKLLVREANGKATVEFETGAQSIELPLGRLLDHFEELASRQDRATVIIHAANFNYMPKEERTTTTTTTTQNVTVHGSVSGIIGVNLDHVNQAIQNVPEGNLRTALDDLKTHVDSALKQLPDKEARKVVKNLEIFTEEAGNEEPDTNLLTTTRDTILTVVKTAAAAATSVAGVVTAFDKIKGLLGF